MHVSKAIGTVLALAVCVATLLVGARSQDSPQPALSVVFALAETAAGPAKGSAPATIQKTPGGALIPAANLPIATLPADDAVARAVVTVDGPAGRVVGTLRKIRR